jgi:hypothetical protein
MCFLQITSHKKLAYNESPHFDLEHESQGLKNIKSRIRVINPPKKDKKPLNLSRINRFFFHVSRNLI